MSCLVGGAATADSNISPNAGMRYVAVDYAGDSEHNREGLITLSQTFGDRWWGHLSGGKIRTESAGNAGDSTVSGLGVGVGGERWHFSVDADTHRDGDKYRQTDWNASLGINDNRWSIAVDGMHRNTDIEDVLSVTGQQGNTVAVPVLDSIDGNGYGLHGSISPIYRLDIFAGWIKYSYDVSVRQNGAATLNGISADELNAFLARFVGQLGRLLAQRPVQASLVARSEALLDRTYNAGLSYQFDTVALTAEYLNDKTLQSGAIARTVQLTAEFFVGTHWLLAPGIGRTTSDEFGDVTFGTLSVNYSW